MKPMHLKQLIRGKRRWTEPLTPEEQAKGFKGWHRARGRHRDIFAFSISLDTGRALREALERARPVQIEQPVAWYHVAARGNERRPIYWDNVLLMSLQQVSGCERHL